MYLNTLKVIFSYSSCGLNSPPGCSCRVMTALNPQLLPAYGWMSYGLNLLKSLNLAESSGLRIVMILLLLLLLYH